MSPRPVRGSREERPRIALAHLVALSTALTLTPHLAVAQAEDALQAAQAEQLFREARALLDAGDAAGALPKLVASQKLDPAVGTLMNLARCHELLGQTASAWGQYLSAAAQARRDGDPERAGIADELARALEPKLVQLRVELAAGARAQGVAIALGDRPLDAALLGTGVPYDPGEYELVASAPGYRSWTTHVRLVDEGKVVLVEVPALEVEAVAVPSTPASPAVAAPAPAPPSAASPADPVRSRSKLRSVGWGSAGAGVLAVGVGMGVGLSARSAWGNAEELGCRDGACPTSEAQTQAEKAGRRADVATGVTTTGGVLLATGIVLLVVERRLAGHGARREGDAAAGASSWRPTIGPTGVGFAF